MFLSFLPEKKLLRVAKFHLPQKKLKEKQEWKRPDVVAHTFNPSTLEAEAGGSLWVWDHPGLQIEFQDNQGYVERPCVKNTKKQTNKQAKIG